MMLATVGTSYLLLTFLIRGLDNPNKSYDYILRETPCAWRHCSWDSIDDKDY